MARVRAACRRAPGPGTARRYNRAGYSINGLRAAMRLSTHARQVIRDTVRQIFGPDARAVLFGSRVDDRARGGDIDLLVECAGPVAERARKELQLVARLQIRLGDQPIDVLVLEPGGERLPVHERALRTGVAV